MQAITQAVGDSLAGIAGWFRGAALGISGNTGEPRAALHTGVLPRRYRSGFFTIGVERRARPAMTVIPSKARDDKPRGIAQRTGGFAFSALARSAFSSADRPNCA
jgi:hypothetical protein